MKPLTEEEIRWSRELTVFPGQTDIPIGTVACLLGVEAVEATKICRRFHDLNLLGFNPQTKTIRVNTGASERSEDSQALHNRLVSAWGDPHQLPDEYAWRWIAHHLVAAGRQADLRRLLLDFHWLQAKLAATADAAALIADFRFFEDDPTMLLVESAIRLSMPALAADPNQFRPQLLGRLMPADDGEIRALLEQAVASSSCWLRLLRPALTAPGGPLYASLEGHGGGVLAVAVTADGRWVISGSEDSTIRVWDRKSASMVRSLKGHDGLVRGVAVTSDGRRVVSGGNDKTVRIWDRLSGKLTRTLKGHSGSVNAVALTQDGRWVISGSSDRTVRIWECEKGVLARTLAGHTAEVYSVAVSANGRWIFSGSSDTPVRVWDRETGAQAGQLTKDQAHMGGGHHLALCAEDQTVLVSSFDGIWAWDWQSGEARQLRSEKHGVKGLAVTPDGQRVIACCGAKIDAVELARGEVERTWGNHATYVNAVAMSGDGRWLVSGSEDRTVKVWDLECKAEAAAVDTGRILASADGRWAVIQSGAGTQAWDVERAEPVRELASDHWGRALVVTPQGQWWVVGSQRHVVTLWDLESGTARKLGGDMDTRADVAAVSRDGRWLVVGSNDWGDDPLVVWDLESGRPVLDPPTGAVFSVAVSGEGRWIIAGTNGADPCIQVWQRETGEEVRSWKAFADALAVSSDGRWVVAGCGSQVRVWDLSTGKEAGRLEGHTGAVAAVAVSADGRRVISGSSDRTIKVWDREARTVLAALHTEAAVEGCAVAPDGRTIIASDQLARVYFLRLESTPSAAEANR